MEEKNWQIYCMMESNWIRHSKGDFEVISEPPRVSVSSTCGQNIDKLDLPQGAKYFHLLWALLFITLYESEQVLSGMVGGVDEKTYRKWTWIMLASICQLKQKVVSITLFCILC